MALIVEDRVAETTTTTGTGVITLAGALVGFLAFSSVCATSDTVYYTIEGIDAYGVPTAEWETGLGTYSGVNQLTRTTVGRSSNTNAAVTFSAGTKRVVLSATQAYFALLARRTTRFFFTTTPTASEVLCLDVAEQAFTLPANLSGSQVKVGTNATATFALDLQQNGTTIGTISIATSGTATLTTTSGTSKAIAIGDVLKVVAPGTADTTIANVAISLKGTL